MYINVERDALAAAISFVSRQAKSKTIPILACLKIEAGDGRVTFTGHDMDSCSQAEVDAEVKVAGSVAVTAETLRRLVSGMPKGAHVVLKLERLRLSVKCGPSSYGLPCLPSEDFPPALVPDAATMLTLDVGAMSDLFTGSDLLDIGDPNPSKHGCCLHSIGGKLTSVVTDGRCLRRIGTDLDFGDAKKIVVPQRAMEEIARLGASGAEISWSSNLISIKKGGLTYTSKLLGDPYIDYERVLPREGGTSIDVDRDALLEAIGRLMAVADNRSFAAIEWEVGDGDISISLAGADIGEGSERIEHHSGEIANPGRIGIMPGQLHKLISGIDADRLRLTVSDESSPFLITVPAKPNIIAVLMPVRLNRVAAQKAAA